MKHIKEIHDEIDRDMIISYPRNIEEETAKRSLKFRRIFKKKYGYTWPSLWEILMRITN